MDYSLQQHSDPSEWMYSQHDISLPTTTQEPLSEPVPFEDFQFSFGLDPGFSAPIPFDMPIDPPSLNDSSHLLSMDYQHDMDPQQDADLPLTDNNPLLDENDQKAFSQFLDAFFVDKDGQISNAEQMASEFSTMYDAQQPPPLLLNDTYHHSPPAPPSRIAGMDPYQVATSMFLPKPKPVRQEQDEDDEHRRSSILQSLDQQKQLHQRLNRAASAQSFATKETFPHYQDPIGPSAIFLQQSNQVSAPFISKHPSTASQRYHPQQHAPYPPPERHYHRPSTASSTSSSSSSRQSPDQDPDSPHRSSARSSSTSTRRNKSHKELLTEEEKRSNHIASEQKRRSTIRNGFKDLTDIVPTLKNINNSKSTVLFKAVDYIKYLEKRNNHLRDKMKSLEVRVKVEGRVSDMLMHTSPSTTLQPIMVPSHPSQQPPDSELPVPLSSLTTAAKDNQGWRGSSYHQNDGSSSSRPMGEDNSSSNNSNNGSGGGVAAALLAHKSQQQQLMALQEQLQYHQRLLAQQDNEHPQQHQQQQQRYNSMSSSSASSSAHSSPQSSDLYQHPSRWSYDSHSNHHHSTKDPAATDMHPHVRMEVDNDEPLKVSA